MNNTNILKLVIREGYGDDVLRARQTLDKFVRLNFHTLYEGAKYLSLHIPEDYYTCKRIQINNTRLHEREGLKYADGHKYTNESLIQPGQLVATVKDIQILLDAYAKGRKFPVTVTSLKLNVPIKDECKAVWGKKVEYDAVRVKDTLLPLVKIVVDDSVTLTVHTAYPATTTNLDRILLISGVERILNPENLRYSFTVKHGVLHSAEAIQESIIEILIGSKPSQ